MFYVDTVETRVEGEGEVVAMRWPYFVVARAIAFVVELKGLAAEHSQEFASALLEDKADPERPDRAEMVV